MFALGLIKMMVKVTAGSMQRKVLDALTNWLHRVCIPECQRGVTHLRSDSSACVRKSLVAEQQGLQHPEIVTHMPADVTGKGGGGK